MTHDLGEDPDLAKCIPCIYDRAGMQHINYGRFRDDKSKSAPCR
jgi:hypothetical protein